MAYTNIDDPSAHFQTTLYTGNSTANHSITNDGNSNMQPDLSWQINRDLARGTYVVDSSRGVTKYIYTFLTLAEGTVSVYVTSFNSNGFTLSSGDTAVNNNAQRFVTWNWKANGGTTSSNTTGSINATVQANTTAGFSIITWSGTGSAGTIGHGLGVAPAMLIVKNRTTGVDWAVYHKDLIDAGYVLTLNSTDAQVDSGTNRWNHTDPTSSVFSVGSGQQTNQSSNNMICYAFAEKQGYSKFGKYVGNGNADGPFVYTGFKPAFLMIKAATTAGQNWLVQDSKRPAYNPTSGRLFANTSGAENTDTELPDFLSNGFKVRSTSNGNNKLSGTYIYMAFAENPFVTSTGVPACAR